MEGVSPVKKKKQNLVKDMTSILGASSAAARHVDSEAWPTTSVAKPLAWSTAPISARVLTLQAEPVGAVFGVEQHAAAVLAAVAGGRGGALAAAPVGALGAACRPLAPLRPGAIH